MIANMNNTAPAPGLDTVKDTYMPKMVETSPAEREAATESLSPRATKEAFMRMVAQEMAHSLMGKGDARVYDAEDDDVLMQALQLKLKKAQEKEVLKSPKKSDRRRPASSSKRNKSSSKKDHTKRPSSPKK